MRPALRLAALLLLPAISSASGPQPDLLYEREELPQSCPEPPPQNLDKTRWNIELVNRLFDPINPSAYSPKTGYVYVRSHTGAVGGSILQAEAYPLGFPVFVILALRVEFVPNPDTGRLERRGVLWAYTTTASPAQLLAVRRTVLDQDAGRATRKSCYPTDDKAAIAGFDEALGTLATAMQLDALIYLDRRIRPRTLIVQ